MIEVNKVAHWRGGYIPSYLEIGAKTTISKEVFDRLIQDYDIQFTTDVRTGEITMYLDNMGWSFKY